MEKVREPKMKMIYRRYIVSEHLWVVVCSNVYLLSWKMAIKKKSEYEL